MCPVELKFLFQLRRDRQKNFYESVDEKSLPQVQKPCLDGPNKNVMGSYNNKYNIRATFFTFVISFDLKKQIIRYIKTHCTPDVTPFSRNKNFLFNFFIFSRNKIVFNERGLILQICQILIQFRLLFILSPQATQNCYFGKWLCKMFNAQFWHICIVSYMCILVYQIYKTE